MKYNTLVIFGLVTWLMLMGCLFQELSTVQPNVQKIVSQGN